MRSLIALALSGAGLALLVRWHARTTRYACPACGAEFGLSAWTDFLSAHTPESKLLRCPHCGATEWGRACNP